MQMDEMTQQNAALVEQTAATSKEMRVQAEYLAELMAFFKISAEKSGLPLSHSGQGAAS